jgi:hypothetical protein
VASFIDGRPLLGQRVDLEFVGPSFWSAYIAACASLKASIASMWFCKTWTRQVRRRTSAEITFSTIVSISSFMRAETMTFKRKRDAESVNAATKEHRRCASPVRVHGRCFHSFKLMRLSSRV